MLLIRTMFLIRHSTKTTTGALTVWGWADGVISNFSASDWLHMSNFFNWPVGWISIFFTICYKAWLYILNHHPAGKLKGTKNNEWVLSRMLLQNQLVKVYFLAPKLESLGLTWSRKVLIMLLHICLYFLVTAPLTITESAMCKSSHLRSWKQLL